MNPFAMTDLLRPSIAHDHRLASQNQAHGSMGGDMGYDMSRAAFRLIESTSNLFRR